MTQAFKVRVTFTDEVLGMIAADPEIHEKFIASKAPDAPSRNEEIAASIATEGVEDTFDKQMTVFPRDENGNPFMWDYQVKGFFKDACGMLRKVRNSSSSKVKAYKKEIDGLIFVEERKIPFQIPEGEKMGVCQRPLRASTAQGERIALASSETIPAGSQIEFTIKDMRDDWGLIEEWMDYGEMRGMGQWRNSGKGRFKWEYVDE